MRNKDTTYTTLEELQKQVAEQSRRLEELQYQLEEANETIEAIRSGGIDALLVKGAEGHQLYTLRTADQTYRVFIEKMTEGAVTLNHQGTILYSNTRFATIVNLPLSGVIGLPFSGFIAPENHPAYAALFENGWKADCKGELFLSTGEGNTAVQLSLTTLELEEGLALSIIITDLTYQKAVQEQLRQKARQLEETNRELEASNHDLQQFASVASHDLQEPLRKIQIFSNLLADQISSASPEAKNYATKIIESSRRMKALIIDVLNYSKLSANDGPVGCVDLNEVLQELMEDFELLIAEKGAQVTAGKLPCLDANKGQMRQMFQNIISNALKFSKPDQPPVITIHSHAIRQKSFDSVEQSDGSFCLLRIRDNGIGFDEKYITNIFALFERLNAKDQYEGTGIGMAIAKKIVDKHNGLITATGKEGEGAEFSIILPLKQST